MEGSPKLTERDMKKIEQHSRRKKGMKSSQEGSDAQENLVSIFSNEKRHT
jgi:hypothetical protein